MTATLERQAVVLWKQWGDGYALFTRCHGCGGMRYCRGKRRSRMLCLPCFDLAPESERA